MDQVKAVFNGKFDLVENIKISPFSRAYTFSDSVYEVIPFFNSKPIAFSMHLERLEYSSTELAMNIEIEKVSGEIDNLISSCDSNSGYVYYQITRGVDNIRSHMYSNTLQIETFGYVIPCSFESRPLKVMVCEDIRWGRCNIKSTSLLGNVMSMNSAHKDNCDEVIMHKNNILREAGASNLFFIKDYKICTPALSNNILPGITRALLITELNKIGIEVIEDEFSLTDISNASSAWLTSSTKGLAPIYEITNLKSNLNIKDPIFLKSKEVFDKKYFN